MAGFYEIGLSGRDATISCSDFEDVLKLGQILAPGAYWITHTECGESLDGTMWRETEDWGTLVVHAPDDWRLESLAGFVAGPGYMVV